MILSISSMGRCNCLATHGARIQTSHSSGVVNMIGIAARGKSAAIS
jgi:hypothetical protein